MVKNSIFAISTVFLLSACGGSTVKDILEKLEDETVKVVKDLFGYEDTEIKVDTSKMNDSFSIKLDVNELLLSKNSLIFPSDVARVSYQIKDENGVQLFEYKALLPTVITTNCAIDTTQAQSGTSIIYKCVTDYTKEEAYPTFEKNKTITLEEGKTYKVELEEVKYTNIITKDESSSIKTVANIVLK